MEEKAHSDFWIGDDNIEVLESLEYIQLIKLSHYRRAISNFVNILTNRRIPVIFNTSNSNATDGEVVYLSPKINKRKDFDVAVGLSLHEGSHIVHSDFKILKTLWQRTPRKLYDIAGTNDIDQSTVVGLLKTMLNYVEDRYIDALTYKSAPGYREYYVSLYEKYFNTEKNSKALKSKVYRTPSLDAYEFRIINFTNPNTDLQALPGLEDIYKLIDMEDILRLSDPADRLSVAINVCEIILSNIGKQVTPSKGNGGAGSPSPVGEPGEGTSGAGASKSIGDKMSSDKSDEEPSDKIGGNSSNSDVDEPDDDDKLGGSDVNPQVQMEPDSENRELIDDMGDSSELSESEIKDLKKNLDKQKKFLMGDINRGTISDKEMASIDAISRSGMSLVRVGKDLSARSDFRGIECVVVEKMTNELITDPNFPLYRQAASLKSIKNSTSSLDEAVDMGIAKGRALGKKLQMRDVVNVTRYTRQPRGKIDKRMINELGYNEENIFYTTNIDKYNSVFIHISVDASASMRGEKWNKTITTVVAICKAASMISNIRVSVSFRTTVSSTYGEGDSPYVVMAYDSKFDPFVKVSNQFRKLSPNNTTPEGLAFEAIFENLPSKVPGEDRFFLNFSDGEPFFNYVVKSSDPIMYVNEVAVEHTRKQVENIRLRGYTILSYFIEGSELLLGINPNSKNPCQDNFKRMYGKNASFIDVNNVSKVAGTLNAMFLKKEDDF